MRTFSGESYDTYEALKHANERHENDASSDLELDKAADESYLWIEPGTSHEDVVKVDNTPLAPVEKRITDLTKAMTMVCVSCIINRCTFNRLCTHVFVEVTLQLDNAAMKSLLVSTCGRPSSASRLLFTPPY